MLNDIGGDADAGVADVDVWPGDQLGHFLLALVAEGTP
jgi:hypothetical protein